MSETDAAISSKRVSSFSLSAKTRNSYASSIAVFAVLSVAAVGWMTGVWIRKQLRLRLPDLFLGLFLLWAVVRTFIFQFPEGSNFVFREGIALVFVYAGLRISPLPFRLLFPVLAAGAFLEAGIAWLQCAGVFSSRHSAFPFTGSFANPGPLAGFLAVLLVLFLPSGKPLPHFVRFLLVGFLLFTGGIILLSDSRAAWVGVIAGGVVAYAPSLRKAFGTHWGKVVLSLAVVFLIGGALLLYRWKQESADGRLLIWKSTLLMWKEAPLCGHGAGSFASHYMNYQAAFFEKHPDIPEKRLAGNNMYAFNEYLRIGCEQGVTGLALFLAFILLLLLQKTGKKNRMVRAALVTWLVFAFFSYPGSLFPLKFLFIGLCALLANRSYRLCVVRSGWLIRCSVFLVLLVATGFAYRDFRLCYRAEQLLRTAWHTGDKQEELHQLYPRLCGYPEFILYCSGRLYDGERYQEALPVLRLANRLRPSPEVLCCLGECLARNGEEEAAESCFLRASRMTPAYLMPHYHLLELYRNSGDTVKAQAEARLIRDFRPKIVNSYTLEAKRIAREFLEQFPDNRPGSGEQEGKEVSQR